LGIFNKEFVNEIVWEEKLEFFPQKLGSNSKESAFLLLLRGRRDFHIGGSQS
jgi:hypothetical protein